MPRNSPILLLKYLALAILLALAALPCLGAPRDFPLGDSAEFLAKVKADEDSGLLTLGEGLLIRFQYALAPDDLPEEYRVAIFSPLKCLTDLVLRYHQMEGQLEPSVKQAIAAYLTMPESRFSFISSEGHFRLVFDVVGENAVPVQDISPENGVPDFVEKAGQYLELAWTVQVLMVGFPDPLQVSGPILVTFRSMQNYGYTNIEDAGQGTTSIILHNNFSGFPPNDDPDGDAQGACKVTAAHEFKHSSQYMGSRWSEGGWIELDAVWVEDLVFDQTNDYYNYLIGGSPIRHPEVPLDGGSTTTGSYEDCVFETWMQETWGVGIIVDFWRRRITHTTEPVLDSYAAVFTLRGVDPAEAWGLFAGWNYATGFRSLPGLGYGESSGYPMGPVAVTLNQYPASCGGSVDHLAADFVRLQGLGEGSEGSLEAELSFEPGEVPLTLTFIIEKADGSGVLETVEIQGGDHVLHTLGVPLGEIATVGVVIGNPVHGGPARWYELSVALNLSALVPVPDLETSRLDGNSPNPFNPVTQIRFRLAEQSPVFLDILDVRGRLVRRFNVGICTAGSNQVSWDGRDDGGRALPAGVYLARLRTPNFTGVSKMTLAK